MKRLPFLALAAVVAFVALPALAREIAKAKITSSGTSASSVTGCGRYAVQGDAAFCVNTGQATATADCTLGTANSSVSIQSGQLYDLDLPCAGADMADTIAVISVSGTANVQVFRVALTP